jgi:hypothetical protein
MTSSIQSSFYLLSILEFDVGSTHVKFYGVIKATTNELTFGLSKDILFDPKLLPAGKVTTSLDAPLGMTGVRLEDFDVQGRIYKGTDDKTAVDITLSAAALFTDSSLSSRFRLAGALVLEQTSPRLALVTLSADQPLTLKDFVRAVIGGKWDWADGIADQFALWSGYMYYLKPPPNPRADYTYPYPQDKPEIYCLPGYHMDAKLRIFQKYDFEIKLAVVDKDITLSGTYCPKIDFDFVTLNDSTLEISTRPPPDKYLKISTTAVVFGTPIPISIEYETEQKAFKGQVSADPITVSFTWTKASDKSSGFQITDISGLPLRELDLIRNYLDEFNSLRPSGGCQKILGNWLDGIETSLTPTFNGSPSRDKQTGWMILPLKITYAIKVGDQQLDHCDIEFEAHLEIPHSLSDLPGKMWDSLIASSEYFVTAIINNPNTYRAIAEYVSLKYGAQALARFICRALDEVAKDLAKLAEKVFAESLEAAAELAAQLARVALLGLSVFISGLIDLLNELAKKIWNALTGKDDDAKRDAINKVKAQVDIINGVVSGLQERIKAAEAVSTKDTLKVSIDEENRYVARWAISESRPATLRHNVTFQYNLTLLDGMVGDQIETPWYDTDVYHPGVSEREFNIPMDEIPHHQDFQLNASLSSSIRGIVFLDPNTHQDLVNAIQQLRATGVDEIKDQANRFDAAVSVLWNYNQNGISTTPIYATLDMPRELTISQSRININTEIRNAQIN